MQQLKHYSARLKGSFAARKTYFKILFSITGCTLTAVLLLSFFLYRSVRDMMTQQSTELAMQSFAQIRYTVDSMRATANAVSTQVLLDDPCGQILLASDADSIDPIATYKAVRQLTLYKNVHENIDSIYLYNRGIDKLVTSEVKSLYDSVDAFYDAQLVTLLQHYKQYSSPLLVKRRVLKNLENGFVQDKDVYTYIVPSMYDTAQLKSAVVVNISAEWLIRQLVDTQNLDHSLMVVFDTDKATPAPTPLIELNGLGDIPREAFRAPLLQMLERGETFAEYTYQNEKYCIAYTPAPQLGWHFVKVSRFDAVFGVLQKLQSGMTLLVCSIVGVCVLLSLFGAGSLYKLFHAVEGNYNRLVHSRRSQGERMRENFLGDFLTGSKHFTPEQLAARLDELELSLPDAPIHTPVLLRIEHFEAMKQRFGGTDMHNIKYGLRNIFEELCEPVARVTGFFGKDNHLAFILTPRGDTGMPLPAHEVQQVFASFCQKVQIFVPGTYNLIGAAQPAAPAQLPEVYSRLCAALSETFFYPSNAYVDCDEALQAHSRPLDTASLSHRILPALLSANAAETRRQYAAFVQTLEGCSRDDHLNALIWLGFSIARTVSELETPAAPDEQSYFAGFLVKLMACEKQHEVDRLFEAVFTEAEAALEQANNKTGAWGKLDEIQRYLGEHYTDPNLSLEGVADHFGISPSYLGKIFRKSTGMSLAEGLNQIRLEHVVAQMAASGRSVKDIAADCGFAGANYFYTYFKKKYGLTPQAYREKICGRG